MPQYAKPLTLHKGVDNQIQFQFLNQEQKPVDISGKGITCRILSADGTTILLSKTLDLLLPVTGIATLTVNAVDIEDIIAQKAFYSLEIPSGSFDFPVFVDQNAGGRGDMYIVNSILPSFIPSSEVTIPSGQDFPNLNPNANTTTSANVFYSSVIGTEANPVLSLQAQFTDYFGNVTIQGSTVNSSDWYDIETHTYDTAQVTDTFGYTINGFHPYIRMVFTSNVGSVTNILAR